jgi:single-strand DNA-binding protein
MAGIQKTILIGNLGKDPEIRYVKGRDGEDTAVSTVNIAVTDYTGKNTEWFPCVFWGRQAETLVEYCKKGSKVYVEGTMQTRTWQDKEGNERSRPEWRVATMQMLSNKREEGETGETGGTNVQSAPAGNGRASSSKSSPTPISQRSPGYSPSVRPTQSKTPRKPIARIEEPEAEDDDFLAVGAEDPEEDFR